MFRWDKKPTSEDVSTDNGYSVLAVDENYKIKVLNWSCVKRYQPWMPIPDYKSYLILSGWNARAYAEIKKEHRANYLRRIIEEKQRYINACKDELRRLDD